MSPRNIGLMSGPLLALCLYLFVDLVPGNPAATGMAAITLWMAVWWMTEVVSLAVTSLLPVVFLPALGIADARLVASQYMDPIIFLFIGGFIIAFSIERWELHKRAALVILGAVGSRPSNVLMGVMLTSFFFSMWISNTATVMMLISAVLAIISQVEIHLDDEEKKRRLSTALLIGLAYSATIGGMATLVGTPTNMIFLRTYRDQFPLHNDMNFAKWFAIGFPLALVLLVIAYFLLQRMFIRKDITVALDRNFFLDQKRMLGKMSYEQRAVGIVFVLTAVFWFTRDDIDFGSFIFKGWSNLFGKFKGYIHDSTVAIFMAVLLFLIPSKKVKGQGLITWDDVTRMPFDIILLFGSGFALAKGFEVSGLSTWLAFKLEFLSGSGIVMIILGICIVVAVISEFASNVASIQLVIPILVSMQKVLDVHPLLLMIPATLAASLGFMLPVATAPNTIVFGSKRIRVKSMMGAGLVLDIVGILMITAATYLFLVL